MLNLVQHLKPFGMGLLRRCAPRNDRMWHHGHPERSEEPGRRGCRVDSRVRGNDTCAETVIPAKAGISSPFALSFRVPIHRDDGIPSLNPTPSVRGLLRCCAPRNDRMWHHGHPERSEGPGHRGCRVDSRVRGNDGCAAPTVQGIASSLRSPQ
jgi:hypothetical protein